MQVHDAVYKPLAPLSSGLVGSRGRFLAEDPIDPKVLVDLITIPLRAIPKQNIFRDRPISTLYPRFHHGGTLRRKRI
jgi:hypothetical protein